VDNISSTDDDSIPTPLHSFYVNSLPRPPPLGRGTGRELTPGSPPTTVVPLTANGRLVCCRTETVHVTEGHSLT